MGRLEAARNAIKNDRLSKGDLKEPPVLKMFMGTRICIKTVSGGFQNKVRQWFRELIQRSLSALSKKYNLNLTESIKYLTAVPPESVSRYFERL